MSSVSPTPMTRSNTGGLGQLQQQQLNKRTSTPSLQEQQNLLLSNIEKSEAALKEIEAIEIIPVLFELIENLKMGKISPKDFDNAAGRLRLRISKLKTLLNSIDGLNESSSDKMTRVAQLNEKAEEKKQLLIQFKQSVLKRLESDETGVE